MATCRRVRLHRRKVVMYLMVSVIWFLTYRYTWPLKIDIQEESLTELSKCPACYGVSLCPSLQSGDLDLHGYTAWSWAKLFNVKNVFHGFWTSRNMSVVVKKLGYDTELAQLDLNLCELVHLHAGCDESQAVQKLVGELGMVGTNQKQGLELSRLDWQKVKMVGALQERDWAQCSSQEKLDYLTKMSLKHPSTPLLSHLVTMLLVNQEPILAMALPALSGWPLPTYLGSCGRLAIFSSAGSSLATFISSSWAVRMSLAIQLLEMAFMLSENSLNLAIYPTDWAAENFAVDLAGKVRLVDLENIVLVNKTMLAMNKPPGWDEPYSSDNYGCPDNECFSYSSTNLCNHALTDHNFHGVCGSLLSPSTYSMNLLHSIPREVVNRNTILPELLERCWRGGGEGGRKIAAEMIKDILAQEMHE